MKIQINPTQAYDHQCHPVVGLQPFHGCTRIKVSKFTQTCRELWPVRLTQRVWPVQPMIGCLNLLRTGQDLWPGLMSWTGRPVQLITRWKDLQESSRFNDFFALWLNHNPVFNLTNLGMIFGPYVQGRGNPGVHLQIARTKSITFLSKFELLKLNQN